MEQQFEYHSALKESELAEGSTKGVVVAGVEVLLAKVEGQVYALANRCGHMSMYLSEGRTADHTVECALHGAVFDLRSGAVVKTAQIKPDLTANFGPRLGHDLPQIPTRRVSTYKVRVEDGIIHVGIPGAATSEAM